MQLILRGLVAGGGVGGWCLGGDGGGGIHVYLYVRSMTWRALKLYIGQQMGFPMCSEISPWTKNIVTCMSQWCMHVSMMSCNYEYAWIRYTFACVLSDNSHICDPFYAVLLFNWYRIYSLDGFNICQHVYINWCELRFSESSLNAINRMPLQFSVTTTGLIVNDSTHRECLNTSKWRSLDIWFMILKAFELIGA